jgi:hypothetical protein
VAPGNPGGLDRAHTTANQVDGGSFDALTWENGDHWEGSLAERSEHGATVR